MLRVQDQSLFWPLDPGWVKNPDQGSGFGMNSPDHISKSLEKILGLKILKFFDTDPEISGFGFNTGPQHKRETVMGVRVSNNIQSLPFL